MQLYFIDGILDTRLPSVYQIDYWLDDAWHPLPLGSDALPAPQSHRPTELVLSEAVRTTKLRLRMTAENAAAVGLTEWETWGPAEPRATAAANPNRALNRAGWKYPRANASFAFVKHPAYHLNDGSLDTVWSSVEARGDDDQWVEIDFDQPQNFKAVQLYFLNSAERHESGAWFERIVPPQTFRLLYEDAHGAWQPVKEQARESMPDESVLIRVEDTQSRRLRVVMQRQQGTQVGLREMAVTSEE